jgi:hypothetical protein
LKKNDDIAIVYVGKEPSAEKRVSVEKDARDELSAFLNAGRPKEACAERLFDALNQARLKRNDITITILSPDPENKTGFFLENLKDLGLFLPKSRSSFLKDSFSQLTHETDPKEMYRLCYSVLAARNKAGGSFGDELDTMLAGIIEENKTVDNAMQRIKRGLEEKAGLRTAIVYGDRERDDRSAVGL